MILLSLFFSASGASFETTLVLLLLFLGLVVARSGPGRRARLRRCARDRAAAPHERPDQRAHRVPAARGLVYMSEKFGLEVVLGAFLAGAMVSLLDREGAVRGTGLRTSSRESGSAFHPDLLRGERGALDLDALFSSLHDRVGAADRDRAAADPRPPALIYRRFLRRAPDGRRRACSRPRRCPSWWRPPRSGWSSAS